jgi:DNA mismatch endonuclease (patch repair protein)
MRSKTPDFRAFKPSSPRASVLAASSSRKRDTRCEVMLKRELRARGLRFRSDVAALPGRPDIVITAARVAVFCDGDYWHGKRLAERLRRLRAGHNPAYWVAKIKGNVARDRRVRASLRNGGWTVVRAWESDIRRDVGRVADRILAKSMVNHAVTKRLRSNRDRSH